MLLAGDIGGTNSRLALVDVAKEPPRMVAVKTFRSGAYSRLEQILREFTAEFGESFDSACFGIAGPIRQQRCEATNLPWVIDGNEISKSIGGVPTILINDLEATACGISALGPEDFEVLNPGAPDAKGNACVISAGTGLGEAGIYFDGHRSWPFATEGGHSSFAPGNDVQIELLQYLRRQFEHVSWERVLSGPGLLNIYCFLRDTRGGEEPEWLRQEMRAGDPAPAISRAALAGRSELCQQALDLFVALYGQECGNAGLKFMATGGIYLGGGIAPKILARLRSPVFLDAYLAKGRMRPLLEAMPVRVILNEKTGLLGAAVYAMSRRELALGGSAGTSQFSKSQR